VQLMVGYLTHEPDADSKISSGSVPDGRSTPNTLTGPQATAGIADLEISAEGLIGTIRRLGSGSYGLWRSFRGPGKRPAPRRRASPGGADAAAVIAENVEQMAKVR
jgi:hypothetical protein